LKDSLAMNIFFAPDINSPQVILSPEESAHCVRVLRLNEGEKVQLIDGKGGLYEAVVAEPDARRCMIEIIGTRQIHRTRDYTLHIAIAPTKNMDRFEWFVEKSVEIGVDTITPLLCQRSERRVLKTDRLHKLIISTMKQAMVLHQPVLNELTDYKKFMTGLPVSFKNRLIAHCEDTERKTLKDTLMPLSDVVVLIGPEGDFSPEEIKGAADKGFTPVTLGPNRLRTETAGIVACHAINLLMER
jgi:16S rRNA (uracil1498-N3)-methyltransferase